MIQLGESEFFFLPILFDHSVERNVAAAAMEQIAGEKWEQFENKSVSHTHGPERQRNK